MVVVLFVYIRFGSLVYIIASATPNCTPTLGTKIIRSKLSWVNARGAWALVRMGTDIKNVTRTRMGVMAITLEIVFIVVSWPWREPWYLAEKFFILSLQEQWEIWCISKLFNSINRPAGVCWKHSQTRGIRWVNQNLGIVDVRGSGRSKCVFAFLLCGEDWRRDLDTGQKIIRTNSGNSLTILIESSFTIKFSNWGT